MRLDTISAELAALLRSALPDTDVFPAADGGARDLLAPLARPAVVVTLQKIEALPTALGDCLGRCTIDESERELYGRQADITVGLALYAGSEAACHALFADISQVLLLAEEPAVQEVSCGKAEYKLPVEAWRLAAQTRFPLLLTRDEPAENIRSFRLTLSDPKGATT